MITRCSLPEDDKLQNVKFDRRLSKVFVPEKNYMSRNNSRIFMFACTTVLYEYINLHWNYVYNLFFNMHVQIKIYREFYHGFIYIANEVKGVM